MSKLKFTVLVDEVLNEFDCRIDGILYTDDNIAIVNYSPNDVNIYRMYIPYRFMNRARLRLLIMDKLDLLVPVDPEIDLGL